MLQALPNRAYIKLALGVLELNWPVDRPPKVAN
jgi:hypothetical protein